jgi:hypothetical protein
MSLDIYLSRNPCANTHERAGTNRLKICENLNHADPRTTTLHYLENFDQDTLDCLEMELIETRSIFL